jgi:hypothetical protein
MGSGGGEGRVPSLMTAAVEREVSNSYLFSFFFDVSSMGLRLKRERNEGCINPKRISPWVTFSAGSVRGVACRFGFAHDH